MADLAFAKMIVMGLAAYFGIGVLFALVFVIFLASRLDHAARSASLLFRPMIFFGCVIIWPLLLIRTLSFRTINEPIKDVAS